MRRLQVVLYNLLPSSFFFAEVSGHEALEDRSDHQEVAFVLDADLFKFVVVESLVAEYDVLAANVSQYCSVRVQLFLRVRLIVFF